MLNCSASKDQVDVLLSKESGGPCRRDRPDGDSSQHQREKALEETRWQHGAFTYAILQALEGKGDMDGDRRVSLEELKVYVNRQVPKLTNGAQHPTTVRADHIRDFPLALVE